MSGTSEIDQRRMIREATLGFLTLIFLLGVLAFTIYAKATGLFSARPGQDLKPARLMELQPDGSFAAAASDKPLLVDLPDNETNQLVDLGSMYRVSAEELFDKDRKRGAGESIRVADSGELAASGVGSAANSDVDLDGALVDEIPNREPPAVEQPSLAAGNESAPNIPDLNRAMGRSAADNQGLKEKGLTDLAGELPGSLPSPAVVPINSPSLAKQTPELKPQAKVPPATPSFYEKISKNSLVSDPETARAEEAADDATVLPDHLPNQLRNEALSSSGDEDKQSEENEGAGLTPSTSPDEQAIAQVAFTDQIPDRLSSPGSDSELAPLRTPPGLGTPSSDTASGQGLPAGLGELPPTLSSPADTEQRGNSAALGTNDAKPLAQPIDAELPSGIPNFAVPNDLRPGLGNRPVDESLVDDKNPPANEDQENEDQELPSNPWSESLMGSSKAEAANTASPTPPAGLSDLPAGTSHDKVTSLGEAASPSSAFPALEEKAEVLEPMADNHLNRDSASHSPTLSVQNNMQQPEVETSHVRDSETVLSPSSELQAKVRPEVDERAVLAERLKKIADMQQTPRFDDQFLPLQTIERASQAPSSAGQVSSESRAAESQQPAGELRDAIADHPQPETFSQAEIRKQVRMIEWTGRESMSQLANRIYGEAGWERALFQFNRQRATTSGNFAAGTRILFLPKSMMRFLYPELVPATQGNSGNASEVQPVEYQQADASTQANANRVMVYQTRGGETIFGLAAEYLGQASRYTELMEMNRMTLEGRWGHVDPLPAGLSIRFPID